MSQWKSTEDELPEVDLVCLLHCGATNGTFIGTRGHDDDGWFWCHSYGDVWWNGEQWEAEAEADDDYQVTDWCPLPCPPTKDSVPSEPPTTSIFPPRNFKGTTQEST